MCERHSSYVRHLRAQLSLIVLPIQRVVDAPIRIALWLSHTIVGQQKLLEDNASLRAHELLLEAKLQRQLALQRENEHLRELLSSTTQLGAKLRVAQLLAVDLDPSTQQVILDKGYKQKVYEGQAVLDAYGVMGQVVTVGPYTSRVLLISDLRSAIPVQDNRSGVRAIAMGMGSSGLLSLINIPSTAELKLGDVLVSSGLGQRFPAGYPVGRVMSVKSDPGEPFASIVVEPSARLSRTEQVLLIWPDKSATDDEVQTQLQRTEIGGRL